ncbi:MAG TPA: S9 family peptidase [Bryobacteraceae bacterium]|nr:S9 family peptidase [Bryobacteraceae bacterium]
MQTAPYGSWKSPITSDLIVAKSIGLYEICLDGGSLYWLESRPNEGGRYVVVAHGAEGESDVNPPPFNVRTRANEYGGGSWTVDRGMLYFSNFADQRLYRQQPGAAPQPLTPEAGLRYADGLIDRKRNAWIGVREDHTAGGHEPTNTVVRIPLGASELQAGSVIASGHDFFSSPRLSPDGRWLAYLAWDHPRMPWEGTTLYTVTVDDNGAAAGEPVAVAGGQSESIFQPEWTPDGAALTFISDRTGWWNLYRFGLDTQKSQPLAPMEAEFGEPQWVFGLSKYAFAGPRRLVCAYSSKGLGKLATIDLDSGQLTPIDLPYTDFSYVRADGDQVFFRGASATTPAGIVRLELGSGKIETFKKTTTVADDPELARHFTKVQSVEFPTTGNKTAFGLYYPAFHPGYEAPKGDKPPLLVKCHGGPTAAASSMLDLRIQYWTSRGIAVLDVNYGGSTGFGREYRQRLEGNWGIVDVDDCVNGARYLAEQGWADGARSVITGGSAGGYTVLAALTFRDYFRGGASHYGVSDLAVLARDTHKFEARYLDSLIGPYPEREDLYRERSPITYADRLSVPVIFFQGDEDMVVPPEQSEMMVNALRRKGTPVGYFLFSGEQHGFRKSDNIKRSLDAELYFYAVNVFRIGLVF